MTGQYLYETAKRLYPKVIENVEWDEIWLNPLESGAAFEWTTLIAIIRVAEDNGWTISVPILSYENGQFLFKLRNEIPTQYVGRPGNSYQRTDAINIKDQFLQALIPKFIIEKGDKIYSIFREGCPYHKIMLGQNYSDRPDILFLAGKPTENFPSIIDDTLIKFQYELEPQFEISGLLQIINASSLPIYEKKPENDLRLPIWGIIECSVNKSKRIAEPQLEKYEKLFNSDNNTPYLSLLTGNKLILDNYLSLGLDVYTSDVDKLEQEFIQIGKVILESFSII